MPSLRELTEAASTRIDQEHEAKAAAKQAEHDATIVRAHADSLRIAGALADYIYRQVEAFAKAGKDACDLRIAFA